MTWNEGGVLAGARHITLAGHYAYIAAAAGLVVVDLDDPLQPRHVATMPLQRRPRLGAAVPLSVGDRRRGAEAVRRHRSRTRRARCPSATVPLADARRVYLARTYAYVAAKQRRAGDRQHHQSRAAQRSTGRSDASTARMNDVEDVIVASTNASLFAYVADGRNGMKVLQLTSPDSQPNFYGFSPRPMPELIAWARTPSPALALSKGLDRDRAVDETGGQIAVFGRLGSRPFTRAEMERLFLNSRGLPYQVSDTGTMDDWVAGALRSPPAAHRHSSESWNPLPLTVAGQAGRFQPSLESRGGSPTPSPLLASASGSAAAAWGCSGRGRRGPRRCRNG